MGLGGGRERGWGMGDKMGLKRAACEDQLEIISVVKICAAGLSLEFQTRCQVETPKEVSAVFPDPVSVAPFWTADADRSHP